MYQMREKYLGRYANMRWYNHYKKVYETNQMYCNICGISLKDHIGKDIVINERSGTTRWTHINCAIEKNLIEVEMEITK